MRAVQGLVIISRVALCFKGVKWGKGCSHVGTESDVKRTLEIKLDYAPSKPKATGVHLVGLVQLSCEYIVPASVISK